MSTPKHDWIAIVSHPDAPLPAGPAAGDRAIILVRRSRAFPSGPAFVGSVDVRPASARATTRHRVAAPKDHAIALRGFSPTLHVAVPLTDARLDALTGSCIRVQPDEAGRIEEALLEAARRFGPPPSRPAHRRPRTPGIRARIAGLAASRGSQFNARSGR